MFATNSARTPTLALDELDVQLIEQLKTNARQPASAIAQKLGVSRETVRYRLNRLTSAGILRIVCVTRAERLGYQFKLVIGVRARPGCSESVAQQLADLPGIVDVSLAGSRYNFLVWAIFRDRWEFSRFVSKDLASVSDVLSLEIMHSFHLVKDFGQVQQHESANDNDFSKAPLSDLEQSIIRAMQQDPRQTITELAASIGCSRPVARAALGTLVREGTIGFVPVVDAAALGFNNWVVLLIKAEPDKVNALTHALSAQDAAWHVSLVTGQWQVYAVAVFQDSGQVSQFTAETLGTIGGITEFEVIPLGRHVKFTFPPGSEMAGAGVSETGRA